MGWKRRFAARLGLGLVALAVSVTAFGKINGGYSAANSTSLLYVRLTQTGNELTGYIQTLQATDKDPGYATETKQVSGQIDGKAFVVNSIIQGSVQGDKLKIEFPTSNGQSTSVTLLPTSLKAWNATAEKFKSKFYARVNVRNFQLAFADYCKACKSDSLNARALLDRLEVEKSADEMDKEFSRDANKTIAQVHATDLLLNAPLGQSVIKSLYRGHVNIAAVSNSAKLYSYAAKDSFVQTVGDGWICPSIKVDDSWSLILFNGRLYWISCSDLNTQIELVFSP